jgi:prepilin-type N-terminal cleavage/methylation domain-containing protein
MRRPAFTLLEVMLVAMILATVLTLATLTIGGPLRRARMTQALDKLENFDRFARTVARREHIAYEIVFDRKKRSIEVSSKLDTRNRNRRVWYLPSGVDFQDFRNADGVVRQSRYGVLIASNGTSPNYAVELGSKDGTRWLMTFGFSGKQLAIKEETDVAAIFR